MEKTALITGANKGLGFETCRQLAQAGFSVYLTARDATQGAQAAERLQQQGLEVAFLPLDVASDESIEGLARHLRQHEIKLDLLVNNAGVLLDPHTSWEDENASILRTRREILRDTMEINVYGPIMLIQALIPLFNDRARIINVSSAMGQLAEMGGMFPAYRISKTALNAVTRIFSQELKARNISVNSVHPGWVKTDMGGQGATLEVDQGVATTIWLATTDDVPNGGFFHNKERIEW